MCVGILYGSYTAGQGCSGEAERASGPKWERSSAEPRCPAGWLAEQTNGEKGIDNVAIGKEKMKNHGPNRVSLCYD
jgi:hypothetical protein